MKAAKLIAERLFGAGVRLKPEETGALLIMPQHLQAYVATTWLQSLSYDVEVVVSGIEVRTLGAEKAWLNAVFEDIQKSDFAAVVDSELVAIQVADIAQRRAENRSALLNEQAA